MLARLAATRIAANHWRMSESVTGAGQIGPDRRVMAPAPRTAIFLVMAALASSASCPLPDIRSVEAAISIIPFRINCTLTGAQAD